MSVNDESEEDVSESESEFDWIVGDDEVVEVDGDGDALPRRSESPLLLTLVPRVKKRKGEDAAEATKKRKMLTGPLVPFCKGPCLEAVIGKCEYEPFEVYRIRLLNGDIPRVLMNVTGTNIWSVLYRFTLSAGSFHLCFGACATALQNCGLWHFGTHYKFKHHRKLDFCCPSASFSLGIAALGVNYAHRPFNPYG